jgi:hypothetical protein
LLIMLFVWAALNHTSFLRPAILSELLDKTE